MKLVYATSLLALTASTACVIAPEGVEAAGEGESGEEVSGQVFVSSTGQEAPANPDEPTSPATVTDGALLLRGAIEGCTFNHLWLKDATGDLNSGPMLTPEWPAVVSAVGNELILAEETLAMFSGGGIRGKIVLRLESIDSQTGDWTVAARIDNAAWGGFYGSGVADVSLGAVRINPQSPVVVEDATIQDPVAPAELTFVSADGSSVSYTAKWGLVQSVGVACGEF